MHLIALLSLLLFAAAQGASPPQAAFEALAAGQPARLLVRFDDGEVVREISALPGASPVESAGVLALKAQRFAAVKQATLAGLAGVEVLRDYTQLPMAFVEVRDEAALEALSSRPGVMALYEDGVRYPLLAESLPLIRQPETAALGDTGAGTTVSVIDTGVDYTNPAFGPCAVPGEPGCKVVFAQDFAPDDGQPDDDGHGTNVAGIVLGVAPDSAVAALDVFRNVPGSGLVAFDSDIIAAVDWSIQNRDAYHIVALNLSLGGGRFSQPCPDDALAAPLQNARAAGILPAVAAGNDGFLNALESPACVPAAVSVGAVYDHELGSIFWSGCHDLVTAPDRVTCFSDSASFLKLLAPGALITAAGLTLGGTSQATPHVAGAAAVLRAAFPGESVDQTESRLSASGVPITDHRNGRVTPRIDLFAAVGGAPNQPPDAPSNPHPADGAVGVDLDPSLSWSGGDPDGDPVTFDVFFGPSSTPPLAASDLASAGFSPGPLAPHTLYFWQVVAKDDKGAITTGPLWNFTTRDPEADLQVVKADDADPVEAGQPFAYTVTVTNLGPDDATGVTLTDTLPQGLTLDGVQASQGSCLGTATVVCQLGTLAQGASATVTLDVTPTASGTLQNTASASADETDPDPSNNADTESTQVNPGATGTLAPVYRFNTGVTHFYTISEDEKDFVLQNFVPPWTFEGVAFRAYPPGDAAPGTLPVYRFNTGVTHFYTISEDEKDFVLQNFVPPWTFEGVAFRAYPPGDAAPGTLPVYRFNTGVTHFYTISEDEKDFVLQNFVPPWTFEGVAFYAFPP